ncbi:hypothetical protein AKJ16_DCAP09627 [Drosera capensis]
MATNRSQTPLIFVAHRCRHPPEPAPEATLNFAERLEAIECSKPALPPQRRATAPPRHQAAAPVVSVAVVLHHRQATPPLPCEFTRIRFELHLRKKKQKTRLKQKTRMKKQKRRL